MGRRVDDEQLRARRDESLDFVRIGKEGVRCAQRIPHGHAAVRRNHHFVVRPRGIRDQHLVARDEAHGHDRRDRLHAALCDQHACCIDVDSVHARKARRRRRAHRLYSRRRRVAAARARRRECRVDDVRGHGEIRLHPPNFASVPMQADDAALAETVGPAHVPLTGGTRRARCRIGPAHDPDHKIAGREA